VFFVFFLRKKHIGFISFHVFVCGVLLFSCFSEFSYLFICFLLIFFRCLGLGT